MVGVSGLVFAGLKLPPGTEVRGRKLAPGGKKSR